jgi:hypothetical protein
MTVFVFANNRNITQEFIKNLTIQPNDLFVFMNSHVPLKYLSEYKTQKCIIFLRSGDIGYWGQDEFLENKEKFNQVIVIQKGAQYEIFKNINHIVIYNSDEFITDENNNKIIYPIPYPQVSKYGPQYASTGFIVYHYMKNKFPEHEVVLVKFTAYSDTPEIPIARCHYYNFEHDYYKKYNVKNIV